MKIFKTAFTVSALCVLLFTSMTCKKSYIEKNELPPITQTGANTFGCYVNGEIFLPRKGMYGTAVTARKTGDSFYIKLLDDANIARGIVFKLSVGSTSQLDCLEFSKDVCLYSLCPPITYNFKISKLDETNKIIAGEFNCILPATSTCHEVKITEGRFDLKYTEN